MPRASFASPEMRSKAKPSLKMSRKSKVTRRGIDCSEMRPRSLPAPGSIFANWPFEACILKRPDSAPGVNSYANPGHTSWPSSFASPRLTKSP